MFVNTVVLRNPHMQTTTNMYLVNLSAADILMGLGECIGNTAFVARSNKLEK